MEQNQNTGFYSLINNLYALFTAETNPKDKETIKEKLIVEVWKNTKEYTIEETSEDTEKRIITNWSRHADTVIQTITDLLSENSPYDSSKGAFSNYLLTSIKNNVNAEVNKEKNQEERELPINEVSKAKDSDTHLTDIQKILTIDDIREDLQMINDEVKKLKHNQKETATIITRDILYQLQKYAFELLDSTELFTLIREMDCLDKQLWKNHFYNFNKLPTRVDLAREMEIPV